MFELQEKGVENLCIGVVEQACYAYLRSKEKLYKLKTYIYKIRGRRVLGRERENRMRQEARMIWDCENFFKSDWCKQLCAIEPARLKSKLDEEFKERKTKFILKALAE